MINNENVGLESQASNHLDGSLIQPKSINDVEFTELKVYPNPAKNHLTISVLNENMSSIEVFSVSGQTVFTRQMDPISNKETIDISKLTSGMYFINVTGENGKHYSAKLIKE